MTNELAKQLRNAGFPQQVRGGFMHGEHADFVYFPTLEELIEACGDRFWMLETRDLAQGLWNAAGYGKKEILTAYGKTAKEAVAKIWLLMNKTP